MSAAVAAATAATDSLPAMFVRLIVNSSETCCHDSLLRNGERDDEVVEKRRPVQEGANNKFENPSEERQIAKHGFTAAKF